MRPKGSSTQAPGRSNSIALSTSSCNSRIETKDVFHSSRTALTARGACCKGRNLAALLNAMHRACKSAFLLLGLRVGRSEHALHQIESLCCQHKQHLFASPTFPRSHPCCACQHKPANVLRTPRAFLKWTPLYCVSSTVGRSLTSMTTWSKAHGSLACGRIHRRAHKRAEECMPKGREGSRSYFRLQFSLTPAPTRIGVDLNQTGALTFSVVAAVWWSTFCMARNACLQRTLLLEFPTSSSS